MPTAQPQATKGYPGRWVAMGVLIAAAFMNLLDATIVNVALPVIQKDLNAHSSSIEWIVAGYVLVFALALMPCGRLGDIYGKKEMFLGGVGFFTLSSALSGVAPNIEFLIVARLMQGLGAAIMAPQVLSLVQDMFVSKERSAALSMFGITSGIAIVSGPLIGGWLIAVNVFDMGWRSIFYINVPVGIVAVIAGSVLIPRFPGQRTLRLDKPGVLIVALAFLFLIFPLVEGRRYDWPFWTFVMLLASLPLFAGFYVWETHRAKAGREQLLPVSLMHNHAYLLGGVISFLFYSTPAGLFMTFAIFLQQGFGFTPLEAGLATIPFPLGAFMAAFSNRRLSDNFMKGRILIGAALMTSGLALILFIVWRHSGTPGVFTFAPGLLIGGFSLGFTVSPLFQSMLADVPGPDAGSASGALQAIQQAGSALGIAIASQLFFATIATRQAAGAATEDAYVAGFTACLTYMVAVTAAVFLAAWFLPAVRPGQQPGNEDGEAGLMLL
ncbi:MFS transporter [Martelella sp. HB161492]|uniref:MFS transporter n=1 Tax=Martelella sp. HB161492 TaxID=2720726 RepID=UPI001592627E|nr:MFS transporter [Martelella sp. HB161492]